MMSILKNSKHYKAAFKVAEKLKNNGFRTLFAGGAVRDSLLNRYPGDIDIATSASPQEIQKLFSQTVSVGAQFGVIIVIMDKTSFEVATFRKDGQYVDGRRPEKVFYSDEIEDAKRRDFTINGLFYDPFEDKILDYVNGIKDIQAKVIQTIGEANERFEEDKLRLLRAVRFSCRLGFKIEDKTYQCLTKMSDQITFVSRERIRDEVFKIMSNQNQFNPLKKIKEIGFWNAIFTFSYDEKNETFYKSLPKDLPPSLLLFSLCWNQSLNDLEIIAENFKLSNLQKQQFLLLKDLLKHFKELKTMRVAEQKRKFMYPLIKEYLIFLRFWQTIFHPEHSHTMDFWENQYESFKEKLTIKKLISGNDLIKMSLSPSPLFKKILYEIENLQLEENILTREEALKKALELKDLL